MTTSAPSSEKLGEIAAGLSEAQRRALLAFPEPTYFETVMQGKVMCRPYATARELGVSSRTLISLYGLNGADPETMELGPILVTDEYTREGRFWQIEDLGLAVRALLTQEQADG